jgi:two-component system sensor histidine kinase/response regulator
MNLPPARLLLIDDDELLLTTLVSVMKRQGYSVSAARDGSEGFRLAADIHPDLIICDVRMPSPDGYELKTLLSGSPDTRDIPFIFLTAFGAPEDKVRGLMHGADDYITKPFDLNELIARVQNLLRRMEFGRQRGIKESEEKIRELRQSITANFHHEVRTPLSNLLATLDLALREKFTGNPHAVHRYIESAQNSAQRLRRLIDDLMLLNDIDHNTVSGFRQEIHLRYHFLNVIHNTIQGWSEKNLQAEIQFDETQRIFAPKN